METNRHDTFISSSICNFTDLCHFTGLTVAEHVSLQFQGAHPAAHSFPTPSTGWNLKNKTLAAMSTF